MGVFHVSFGCSGATGFNACCSGVSSGDGGFKVTTSPRPACEKVRPARPDVGASVKKFAQRAENTPYSAFYGVPGELFRGTAAAGIPLGELCRRNAPQGTVSGESVPPPATYQPRTSSTRAGEASHCLVPKDDTDTAATADAKRMRRSGSASPPRSIAHVKAPWKASPAPAWRRPGWLRREPRRSRRPTSTARSVHRACAPCA